MHRLQLPQQWQDYSARPEQSLNAAEKKSSEKMEQREERSEKEEGGFYFLVLMLRAKWISQTSQPTYLADQWLSDMWSERACCTKDLRLRSSEKQPHVGDALVQKQELRSGSLEDICSF